MRAKQIFLIGTTAILVATSSITSYAAKNKSLSLQLNPAQTIVAQQIFEGESASPMMIGQFVAAEKPTKGTALIVNEGGQRYLQLDESFSTSSEGPDLHVLLDGSARPPQSYQNLGNVINLGKLKSYKGAQRYPISSMIDVKQIKSVVIWCQMANATFGYAPVVVRK